MYKFTNPLLYEELFFFNLVSYLVIYLQVVYNANKLSDLDKEKKKLRNWLDFYQLKYSRNQSNRPSTKVLHYQWTDAICDSFHFCFVLCNIESFGLVFFILK